VITSTFYEAFNLSQPLIQSGQHFWLAEQAGNHITGDLNQNLGRHIELFVIGMFVTGLLRI